MGLIISGFTHRRLVNEDLEALNSTIKYIENQEQCTQTQKKKVLRSMDLFLCLVTILVFGIYSTFGSGETWNGRILYAMLITIGVIIFTLIIRYLTSLYFRRKLSQVQAKIIAKRIEKQLILEEVKATENYKVAKEILDKYDSD